jgi:hypothetical protein
VSRNFLSANKIAIVAPASADGTSDVESSIVDTAGFRGVVFLTTIATPGAGNEIAIEQGAANSSAGMAEIAGSAIATGTGTDAMSVVSAIEPSDRFVRCVVKRGVSTTVSEVWAVLYGADRLPQASGAATLRVEQHIMAAEGTA